MTDPTGAPRYGLQLVFALLAAAVLSVGAFGVAAAAVDTAAICSDDHGNGGDSSGHGSGHG
jgi:hypothetical protein